MDDQRWFTLEENDRTCVVRELGRKIAKREPTGRPPTLLEKRRGGGERECHLKMRKGVRERERDGEKKKA